MWLWSHMLNTIALLACRSATKALCTRKGFKDIGQSTRKISADTSMSRARLDKWSRQWDRAESERGRGLGTAASVKRGRPKWGWGIPRGQRKEDSDGGGWEAVHTQARVKRHFVGSKGRALLQQTLFSLLNMSACIIFRTTWDGMVQKRFRNEDTPRLNFRGNTELQQ